MKPITYWVQNDAINQLVDQYGAHLQKLSADDRRDLIALLAAPSYWNTLEASESVDDIFELTEDLTRQEKDLLIEAIAATLNHSPSNPVYDTQKEGTPAH